MVHSDNRRKGRSRGRSLRRVRKGPVVLLALLSGLAVTYAAAAVVTQDKSPQGTTISAPPRPLAFRATPSTLTVTAGETARYILRVGRKNRPAFRRVRMSAAALPAGINASFKFFRRRIAQAPVVLLTVTTTRSAPPGAHRVALKARRRGWKARTSVQLVIAGRGQQAPPSTPTVSNPGTFRIEGELGATLSPGAGEPLDLRLINDGATDLSISRLDVRVDDVTAPRATSTEPCTTDDFTVDQYSGPYGFVLPGAGETSLSELGIPPYEWPSVGMLNTPLNQDGCISAHLTLGFAGSGA